MIAGWLCETCDLWSPSETCPAESRWPERGPHTVAYWPDVPDWAPRLARRLSPAHWTDEELRIHLEQLKARLGTGRTL